MNAAAAIVVVALLGPVEPKLGDSIPRGLHHAATLLHAWELVSEQPVLREDEIESAPVWIAATFTLRRESQGTLRVYLTKAGIYMLPHGDRNGTRYWYASRDPAGRPAQKREFAFEVIPIRFADPVEVARFLSNVVGYREEHLAPEQRTVFKPFTATRRLVARTSIGNSLAPYKQLLRDLDQPPPDDRVETIRSWRARHHLAPQLRHKFLTAWNEQGQPEISVIVQKQSNTLMVRLPKKLWEAARQLLSQLDQPSR